MLPAAVRENSLFCRYLFFRRPQIFPGRLKSLMRLTAYIFETEAFGFFAQKHNHGHHRRKHGGKHHESIAETVFTAHYRRRGGNTAHTPRSACPTRAEGTEAHRVELGRIKCKARPTHPN